MKWAKKFSLYAHYHSQIPEQIPFQKHILRELLAVQVKALNPSQTAEKKQTFLQTKYTCLSEVLLRIITMKILSVRLLKGSSVITNHCSMCMIPYHTTNMNKKVV